MDSVSLAAAISGRKPNRWIPERTMNISRDEALAVFHQRHHAANYSVV
jgi:hypothetical protein